MIFCDFVENSLSMAAPKRQTSVPISGPAIARIRDAWKLTQEDFADVIGTSREWVSRTEAKAFASMHRQTLAKIANAMGVTPDEAFSVICKLVGGEMNPSVPELQRVNIPPLAREKFDQNVRVVRDGIAEIPMFDISLAAGPWADVMDVPGISGDDSIAQGLFRVRLAGDSMEPKYRTGDIVEFEILKDGVYALEIGRNYYVQKEDGGATFKQLAKIERAGFVLRAINVKKYPDPMPVSRAEVVRMAISRGKFFPD